MLQTSSPSIAVNFTIDMLKIQTKWKLMSSMEQISTWYTSCAKWLIMTWPPTWHILRNWISTNCLDWSFIFFYHMTSYCCGCDCMVIGFTTTYAISTYHHWCCEFEYWSGRGVQHYVIKFVSDLQQVGGFLWVLRFPPSIKLTGTIKLNYLWK